MSDMFSEAESFNQDLSSWDPAMDEQPENFIREDYPAEWLPRWGQLLLSLRTLAREPEDNATESASYPRYLTVTEAQLRGAVRNRSFAIESDGIIYTFGDSNYNIDTSQITDMSLLFYCNNMFNDAQSGEHCAHEHINNFNEDIGYWDVSNVTSMRRMFYGARSFNQPIGRWDVSNVTNMENMFSFARSFNQPIGDWDVSNVTDMTSMFSFARSFNQPIIDWNVSSVMDMNYMFFNSRLFNQPIGRWDVSNVTNMAGMFYSAGSFNQPLGDWNVSSVMNMDEMFSYAMSFNQDLSNWSVPAISHRPSAFIRANYPAEWLPHWGQ